MGIARGWVFSCTGGARWFTVSVNNNGFIFATTNTPTTATTTGDGARNDDGVNERIVGSKIRNTICEYKNARESLIKRRHRLFKRHHGTGLDGERGGGEDAIGTSSIWWFNFAAVRSWVGYWTAPAAILRRPFRTTFSWKLKKIMRIRNEKCNCLARDEWSAHKYKRRRICRVHTTEVHLCLRIRRSVVVVRSRTICIWKRFYST